MLGGRNRRLEYGGKAEGVDGEFGSVARLATMQSLVLVNLGRSACGRLPSITMCRFCIMSKNILLGYFVLVSMRCSPCGRLPSNRMCRFYLTSNTYFTRVNTNDAPHRMAPHRTLATCRESGQACQ